MKDCPVLLVAPPDPLAKLVDESVDVSRLLTGGPSLLVRFLSIYHLNIAPNVLCLVRNFFVEVWLELNEIGVWWCDWGVLEVVVEGVVGDVGGEDREGVLRGERAGIGGAGSGGVLCVLGGTRGRGRRGRVDGCDSPRLLTGGVEVGQGLGVVEPGVAQDGRGPPCPSPVSPAGRPVVRAGLLGVLVSPPGSGGSSSSWSSGPGTPRNDLLAFARSTDSLVLLSPLGRAACAGSRPRGGRRPRRGHQASHPSWSRSLT